MLHAQLCITNFDVLMHILCARNLPVPTKLLTTSTFSSPSSTAFGRQLAMRPFDSDMHSYSCIRKSGGFALYGATSAFSGSPRRRPRLSARGLDGAELACMPKAIAKTATHSIFGALCCMIAGSSCNNSRGTRFLSGVTCTAVAVVFVLNFS